MKDERKTTKEQLIDALVRLRQRIPGLETPETERTRAVDASQWRRIWLLIVGMFVLLGILVWLDEILDLPHLLLGVPRTPVNWQEAIIETILIVVIGLFTVSGLIHDITERKRAEVALQEAEARYRALVEQIPAIVYTDSAEQMGQTLYINPQVKAITSYGPEEWMADNDLWLRIMHPDDRERVSAEYTRASESGGPFDTEYRIVTRDGRMVWLRDEATLIRDQSGRPLFWQGIMLDTTERKRAEAQIRKLNRIYAVLSDINQAIVRVREPQALFEQVCRIAVEVGGFRMAWIGFLDGLTQKVQVVAHAGETGSYFDQLDISLRGKPSSYCPVDCALRERQHVLCNAIGRDAPMAPCQEIAYQLGFRSSAAFPLHVFDKIRGTVNLYSDEPDFFDEEEIKLLDEMALDLSFSMEFAEQETQRKRAEGELRKHREHLEELVVQRTAELEAKNRELETFTYSVSHDLKAPLRGIDGYSRLLLEEYASQLDEEGRTFLHTIRRATDQMNQLIDDLLTYSRLERRALNPGHVNPRALVEALAAERNDEINQRGVSLTVDISCESVIADAEGLAQALRNLLDNALKFTRDVPAPRLEIGGRETEKACMLWVRDNGIGFDMRYHDRIFEIFQRLHRTEDYLGTGIGLALVRKAMERMGGRVWAESAPGEGATFYLEIPR
jgi:PAS domain S-box-containing protein